MFKMPWGSHHRSPERSFPPPASLTQSNLHHICAICEKPRSSKYHERHPLSLGQTPKPGICSRPNCAKIVKATLEESLPPVVIQVFEIHNTHNYSVSAGQDELPPYTDATEHHAISGQQAAAQPEHAAELPAQSSLAGRVELPGNSTSTVHSARRSARLPTIWEEGPPVNFSTKPTYRSR
jgi:hypothetical protein